MSNEARKDCLLLWRSERTQSASVPHRGKNGFVFRNWFCVILYLLDHVTGVLTPSLLGDLSSPDLVLPDYCRAGYWLLPDMCD